MSLETIPAEILEYVAFLVATDRFLGPPAHLTPLLLASHTIYNSISPATNPHLYSSIFEAKYDLRLAKARMGSAALTADVLTQELKRRTVVLKRIRSMSDALTFTASQETRHEAILTCYLMMLEDQGKNRDQLEEYANLPGWLRQYWFHVDGGSGAIQRVNTSSWPAHKLDNALGMWLLWFFLKPDDYPRGAEGEAQLNLLKVHALGAHLYSLSGLSWQHFDFSESPIRTLCIRWYSQSLSLIPPTLAVPAILCFFALTNRRRSLPLAPTDKSIPRSPLRDDWSADWGRAIHLPNSLHHKTILDCFTLGSIEGVWEGYFMYTEFTMYAIVLSGAPPNALQKGLVGKHQQTWKLREHYLLEEDEKSGKAAASSTPPLSAGNPLRAWIPTGSKLAEHRDGVTVEEPGRSTPLRYFSASVLPPDSRHKIVDILITGEGHSAWGQFSLVGRVRPCDGFISLSKDYMDGDRGKWLYRGYLAGNVYGNFVGRWRDTLTGPERPGYEGTFALSRRR